jgi:UDP-N-acetyl-D-mannosaminuronate dehydrogenase
MAREAETLKKLLLNIEKRTASVGIIGLGYVVLPLVLEFIRAGFVVRGFDQDSDPHAPRTHKMREYDLKMASVPLTQRNLKKYDCVLISTDHSSYDYRFIVKHSTLVVDSRNATGKMNSSKVIRA